MGWAKEEEKKRKRRRKRKNFLNKAKRSFENKYYFKLNKILFWMLQCLHLYLV